jgi:hypothetical protein
LHRFVSDANVHTCEIGIYNLKHGVEGKLEMGVLERMSRSKERPTAIPTRSRGVYALLSLILKSNVKFFNKSCK